MSKRIAYEADRETGPAVLISLIETRARLEAHDAGHRRLQCLQLPAPVLTGKLRFTFRLIVRRRLTGQPCLCETIKSDPLRECFLAKLTRGARRLGCDAEQRRQTESDDRERDQHFDQREASQPHHFESSTFLTSSSPFALPVIVAS